MKRLKAWLNKGLNYSWLIALPSLVWLLLRSGTNPNRIVYPCQQAAKANVALVGLPVMASVWHRFRKCEKYRAKVIKSTAAVLSVLLVGMAVYQLGVLSRRVESDQVAVDVTRAQGTPRVVWLQESDAAPDGPSQYSYGWNLKANQTVIDGMMEEGVLALTGAANLSDAWEQILPCGASCSSTTVGIKANFNNVAPADCVSMQCPLYEPVVAIIDQLVNEAGVTESNIHVFDSSRNAPPQNGTYNFQDGITSSFPSVNVANSDRGQSPNYFTWNGTNYYIYDKLDNVLDYYINMPLFRPHTSTGFTGALKNNMGQVQNTRGDLHDGFFNTGTSPINSLVALNSQSSVSGKLVLIVGDAIYGLGGDSSHCSHMALPNISPNPNSIFLATDPVASDSVMVDYLENLGTPLEPYASQPEACGDDGGADPRIALSESDEAALGTYETSCTGGESSCDFSYSNIDLVQCPDSVCPGGTPTPTQYSLSVTKDGTGGGTVTSNPAGIDCGATCSADYDESTAVTLTATENASSTFTGWNGGGCGGTGTCQVTMTSAVAVTATFTLNSYTVSGEILLSGSPLESVVLSGLPGSPATNASGLYTGTVDSGWSGTVTPTLLGYTFTPTDRTYSNVTSDQLNQDYTAATAATYTLDVNKTGAGTGTVTSSPSGIDCGGDCTEDYTENTIITLFAQADSGSEFTGWSGGGCSGTGSCPVTLTANTTITATFAELTFEENCLVQGGTYNPCARDCPDGANSGCWTRCVEDCDLPSSGMNRQEVDFTVSGTTGEAPFGVRFLNISLLSGQWSWDFNADGQTDSTDKHPSYVYDQAGIYSVKLTVTDSDGRAHEMLMADYIKVGEGGSQVPTTSSRKTVWLAVLAMLSGLVTLSLIAGFIFWKKSQVKK